MTPDSGVSKKQAGNRGEEGEWMRGPKSALDAEHVVGVFFRAARKHFRGNLVRNGGGGGSPEGRQGPVRSLHTKGAGESSCATIGTYKKKDGKSQTLEDATGAWIQKIS